MEKDDQKPDSVDPHTPEADEGINSSRRNFAKAGVAMAVLMTVANRSTMASTTGLDDQACTFSAMVSAGSGLATVTCGGLSTLSWVAKYNNSVNSLNTSSNKSSHKKSNKSSNVSSTNSNVWPRPCYLNGYDGVGYSTPWLGWNYTDDSTPTFVSICGSQPTSWTNNKIQNPTLWNVISNDPQGSTLDAQFVAALLNAADSTVKYGYTVNDIVSLYTNNVGSNPTGLYNMFKILNGRS